jgi:hypothetical protein
MADARLKNNGESHKFQLTELKINWEGREYHLTPKKVIEAFESAGYDGLSDKKSRFYIEVNHDIKTVQAVFRQIVPIPDNLFSPSMAQKVSEMFEGFGFEILDRRKHHE